MSAHWRYSRRKQIKNKVKSNFINVTIYSIPYIVLLQLQTAESFIQGIKELVQALQRTGDPSKLLALTPHFELLAAMDPDLGEYDFT